MALTRWCHPARWKKTAYNPKDVFFGAFVFRRTSSSITIENYIVFARICTASLVPFPSFGKRTVSDRTGGQSVGISFPRNVIVFEFGGVVLFAVACRPESMQTRNRSPPIAGRAGDG